MSDEQQIKNAAAPEQANCAVGDGSALVAQLVKLAYREHYNCDEDTWYGCPLSSSGCSNDAIPHECNCGADAHNAEVNAIAMKLGLLPNK